MFAQQQQQQQQQLVLMQMLLQVIFAAAIYSFVIQGRGTPQSYLFGFGIVIPLALYTPFYLLEELNIQNKAVKLSLTTLPTIVVFRCLEAMFKTPSHIVVEVTMANYMTYYTSLMSFEWSTKTLGRRKITTRELLRAVRNIVYGFVRISVVLSFMMHVDFQPFGSSKVVLDDYHLSWDLLSPAHLANSYLLGILTYSYLSVGFDLTAFSDQAKGFYTEPIFLSPLWQSRSVSEFWGQRWNLMIHRFLKHGVMRPARKYFSTTVSIFLAFVMSGLLHDLTWSIVFYHHSSSDCATCTTTSGVDCDDASRCYRHKPFKVTAFFLYCGLCMLLERPLAPYLTFLQSWPTPLVAQLVLLTGCPTAHWYTGDWTLGGKFADFVTAVFYIRKIST